MKDKKLTEKPKSAKCKGCGKPLRYKLLKEALADFFLGQYFCKTCQKVYWYGRNDGDYLGVEAGRKAERAKWIKDAPVPIECVEFWHAQGEKVEQKRILKILRKWLYSHCKYDIIVPDEDWEDIKKLIKGEKK